MAYKSLPEMFEESARRHMASEAFSDTEDRSSITYAQVRERAQELGQGLLAIGITPKDHVGLISDNSMRWMIADLATLSTGAADVPRGNNTPLREVRAILEHADARYALVQSPKTLKALHAAHLPKLETLVSLDGAIATDRAAGIWNYNDLRDLGERQDPAELKKRTRSIHPSDLATIIYTSGTSGSPKGVMLTHQNILSNVENIQERFRIQSSDTFLSVLPTWHAFERTVEYVALAAGAHTAISSLRTFGQDLRSVRPTCVVSVPRLWVQVHDKFKRALRKKPWLARILGECLYTAAMAYTRRTARAEKRLHHPVLALADMMLFSTVRERTGGRIRMAVSGGGALPPSADVFFQAAGIPLYNGYGLTETSPVLSVRTPDDNELGTIGKPLPGTDIRIADDAGRQVPQGERGRILARGPQVTKGYYKDPARTAEAFSFAKDAPYFDTGDLGRFTQRGNLQIIGRAKDTIVLQGGENVEPETLENQLTASPYIKHALVVGQDQRKLGALIVPDRDALAARLGKKYSAAHAGTLNASAETRAFYRNEMNALIRPSNGFPAHERIGPFTFIDNFRINEELTETLKKKRKHICEKYAQTIDKLFED